MRWCLLVVLALLVVPSSAQAALDASPPTLGFTQDVTDGASPAQASVVTNSSASPVFLSVTGPTNPEFQMLSDNPFGDCAARVGLFAGESCQVRVRFDPSTTGTLADS